MKVYIIMGNDFPQEVLSDKEAAEKLCAERMQAQHEALPPHLKARRIYWRPVERELDAISS